MDCERCGVALLLLHYDGVPTWVHPGKCRLPDEGAELDEDEGWDLSDMEDDRYFWDR